MRRGLYSYCNRGNTIALDGSVLGGTPPYVYFWTPSSDLSCEDCASPIAAPTVSTCYILVVSDAFGCADTCQICVVVDSVTGINELINYNYYNWSLYPNPLVHSGILTFENSKNENYTLILYDIVGRPVQTTINITTNQIEVERKNLTSGFYLFRLQTEDQIRVTGKLIME